MKKLLCILPALFLLTCTLSCGSSKEITCQGVLEAYRDSGYEIFHKEEDLYEENCTCYIAVSSKGHGDGIYFYFFTDNAAAETYADQNGHHWAASIFSLFVWDPTWIRSEVHGNVVITYTDSDLYEPFDEWLNN